MHQLPLRGLAKANALVIASSEWTAQSADELTEFLDQLTSAIDEIDPEQIIREVNEDREIAGFPPISSAEVAADALRERRLAWRRSAMALLESTPTPLMMEAMSLLVDKVKAEHSFTRFLHELVDDYALRMQPFLAREITGAERLVTRARDFAGSRPDAMPPIFDAMAELLANWEKLTRPIQISATLRGQRDEDSEHLAFTFRNLSVDLFNDYDLLNEAKILSKIIGRYFTALPKVALKTTEDFEALVGISAQVARRDAEMSYSVDIGTFSKSRLAIDKSGVEWRGHRTRLEAVRGVTWGAVRKSVNGIPTGTDYLISWNDGVVTTTAEFRNGAIFEAFIPKLWQGVGFRIVSEMATKLGAGGELRFGNMIARNDTVVLTRRKMFSSEPVEFKWADVSVTSADGSFVVNGPKGSKASEKIGYREIYNIHFFEALVRHAFEKGRVRLSEGFS